METTMNYENRAGNSSGATKRPELLIPAGGPETLRVAVDYGADAVYIGGSAYGLRAKADNFSMDEIREGAEYTHSHGAKLYVTANIFAHNYDLDGIKKYFTELKGTGIDAVLISDPGVFTIARAVMPEMDIHISTQANNTNYETYKFWYNLGVRRVVGARELSLREIREIREHIPDDMEIEAFVHGAMCISYSGRCLLSNYFTGRDANHGACTHPCRWKYSVWEKSTEVNTAAASKDEAAECEREFAVMEENRPGEYLPVEEDERGTYIFNSKDLCMIDKLPDMLEAGIASLKIEGRMKTNLYVAVCARTYREAIDDYFHDPELYESKKEHYIEEISACTTRDFTRGFYYGKPSEEAQIYDSNTYVQNAVYMGRIEDVREDGYVSLYQKNKFSVGDRLEIMCMPGYTGAEQFKTAELSANIEMSENKESSAVNATDMSTSTHDKLSSSAIAADDGISTCFNIAVTVEDIQDEDGNHMDSAPHPKQRLYVKLSGVDRDTDVVGCLMRA